MNFLKYVLIVALFPLFSCSSEVVNPVNLNIRLSQVGYLQNDIKTFVIISKGPILSKSFKVVDAVTKETAFKGNINESLPAFDKFKYCYKAGFTELNKEGNYYIEVDGQRSYAFSIGNKVFNQVTDLLMRFFLVQRCGPTNPLMHGPCHLSDATSLSGWKTSKPVDVTGGWHDAGDYIKFFSTTAYASYMLLFAYEYDPIKFGFDNNHNNVPDILEEARVGIDWLLRCYFTKDNIINQVQDTRDHSVGWRLPENDSLQFSRPAFVGLGKNQIGMFAAVMSLASRIWAEKFYDYEFSKKMLTAAETLYPIYKTAPNVDKNVSGVYQDVVFWGKLALGAVELYNSTKNESYLKDAKVFADSAGSDYWWSWGNINSLAHYKLAQYELRYKDYIYNNLASFNTYKNNLLFSEGMPYTWGTTNSLLGVTLQAILYKKLTGSTEFDSLAVLQRDYILGRNQWGISFITGVGKKYPANIHSQIAYFNNGKLPGALTAGPCSPDLLKKYAIKRTNFTYDNYNTENARYYDDKNDYLTNEPTIVGNATAVFVFGNYSSR
ncbi:MAG: glycoside hydrolase family 9 protein [Bacteroidota bacterium]|nr:glycoside hydrolase family 9 protein [Bacteroidota bacterium]